MKEKISDWSDEDAIRAMFSDYGKSIPKPVQATIADFIPLPNADFIPIPDADEEAPF